MKNILASFIALLLSGWCNLALAAITVEGTAASNGAVGATTVSVTHDSGATGSSCATLTGVVWRDTTDTVSAAGTPPNFNGVAMTLKQFLNNGSNTNAALWYLLAPPRGSFTSQVNLSAAANIAIVTQTFCGVDQSTSFGTVVTSVGGPVSDVVTSASGELVVDVLGQTGMAGVTVGAGQTLIGDQLAGSGDGTDRRVSMSYEAGATSVTMSWTTDVGESQIHIAVPVKDVTASSAITRRVIVVD